MGGTWSCEGKARKHPSKCVCISHIFLSAGCPRPTWWIEPLRLYFNCWGWKSPRNFDTEQCTPATPNRAIFLSLPNWRSENGRFIGQMEVPQLPFWRDFSEGRPPNWEYLGWECWYGSRKCLSFFDLKCLEGSAGESGVKGVLIALLATMIRLGDCLQGLGHHSFSQIQLLPTSHNFVLKNFGQKNGFLQRSFATACSAVLAICLVMEQTSRGLNSLLPLW